jgi:hypothetical protein
MGQKSGAALFSRQFKTCSGLFKYSTNPKAQRDFFRTTFLKKFDLKH